MFASVPPLLTAASAELSLSSPIQDLAGWIWDQRVPEVKQDYPLNLSILLSGGKETNKDCLSNGE